MEVWLQYRAFSQSAPTQPSPKPAAIGTPEPQHQHDRSHDNSGAPTLVGTDQEPKEPNGPALPASSPASYVGFLSGDKANPQNWSMAYKIWVIVQLTFLTLSLTFASSVSSAASSGARVELGGSELAGTATTGAFVVGIGLGAMPFAPMSERESSFCHVDAEMRLTKTVYGRLPVYAFTIILATLFEIGCALAPSMGALIVLRFIAGFFSAAPLSNGKYDNITRGLARTL